MNTRMSSKVSFSLEATVELMHVFMHVSSKRFNQNPIVGGSNSSHKNRSQSPDLPFVRKRFIQFIRDAKDESPLLSIRWVGNLEEDLYVASLVHSFSHILGVGCIILQKITNN